MSTPSLPTQFIKHTTAIGERWDLIAWKYYGDPYNFLGILLANIGYGKGSAEPVFESGRAVGVPIVTQASATPADLPPWRQNL